MYLNQKLLFARVGFTPRVLAFLGEVTGNDKAVNERTARKWSSGETEPHNPFYIATAKALNQHLNAKATEIVQSHDRIILPYYYSDNEYWASTQDHPCPVDVYIALIQRIAMQADVQFVTADAEEYIPLSVNFNLFKDNT